MRERDRAKEGTTPARIAETTPQVYPSGEYTYILEIVMGMQRTLGRIEHAVDTLTTDARDNSKKVSRLSHIICADWRSRHHRRRNFHCTMSGGCKPQ